VSRMGDVGDEMTGDQLDEAFERFLAGRPVPPGGAAVVAFAEEVRQVAAQPGRPSVQLAELLATGLLTDLAGPSARSVPAVPAPAAQRATGRSTRRRRTMIGFLAAGLAKFASAGAIAHAATGATIALAGVTGAGAAGVLPEPVQNGVADAVEFLTPLDFPDSADVERSDETTTPETTGPDTGRDGAAETGADPAEVPDQAGFGDSVREDAWDRGVDGGQVGGEARDTRQSGDARTPAQTSQRATTPPVNHRPAPASVTPRQAPPASQAPQQAPSADQAPKGAPSAPAGDQGGAGRP
jgi:hypothetical protein